MSRFNQMSYDPKSFTVTLGMGGVWDKVYDYLEQFNVTVSGGRIEGVGVGKWRHRQLAFNEVDFKWVLSQLGSFSEADILGFPTM